MSTFPPSTYINLSLYQYRNRYRYLVQYITPDGASCASKHDVLAQIQLEEAKKVKRVRCIIPTLTLTLTRTLTLTPIRTLTLVLILPQEKEQALRHEARYLPAEESKMRLASIELPETFGDVTVLSWGTVKSCF